jgi:hypothetical protein
MLIVVDTRINIPVPKYPLISMQTVFINSSTFNLPVMIIHYPSGMDSALFVLSSPTELFNNTLLGINALPIPILNLNQKKTH